MTSMILRSRAVRVRSHAGQSRRKTTWSGIGVIVLSVRASSKTLPARLLPSGNGLTVKPRRCWATGDSTSFAFSLPHRRRPPFHPPGAVVGQGAHEAAGVLALLGQPHKPLPAEGQALAHDRS